MGKIAFLTRVYNGEPYLRQCVESVLRQTDGNLAYYLCDNGSTDHTRAIIQEYAQKDSRIRPVYFEENLPLASMNLLLKQIYAGDCDYLAVLDGDDWYSPSFAQKGREALERTGAGLFLAGSAFHQAETGEVLGLRSLGTELLLGRDQLAAAFPSLHVFLRTYWGKLLRLSLLREGPLLVDESLYYGSDTIFLLEYLVRCRQVAGTGEILHHYRVYPSSDSGRYSPARFRDDEFQRRRTEELLAELGPVSGENHFFLSLVFLNAAIDTGRLYLNSRLPAEELIRQLEEMFFSSPLEKAWRLVCAQAPAQWEISRMRAVMQEAAGALKGILIPQGAGSALPPWEACLRGAKLLYRLSLFLADPILRGQALTLRCAYARRAGDREEEARAAAELSALLPAKGGLFE